LRRKQKAEPALRRLREYDSPESVEAYFFFAVFLLLDFFAAFAGFLAAIMLTTFHAVRDLPVALLGITRRIAPANSSTGKGNRGNVERRVLMTCDSTELWIQLAIIMFC
jgi:hypothetical protein